MAHGYKNLCTHTHALALALSGYIHCCVCSTKAPTLLPMDNEESSMAIKELTKQISRIALLALCVQCSLQQSINLRNYTFITPLLSFQLTCDSCTIMYILHLQLNRKRTNHHHCIRENVLNDIFIYIYFPIKPVKSHEAEGYSRPESI